MKHIKMRSKLRWWNNQHGSRDELRFHKQISEKNGTFLRVAEPTLQKRRYNLRVSEPNLQRHRYKFRVQNQNTERNGQYSGFQCLVQSKGDKISGSTIKIDTQRELC